MTITIPLPSLGQGDNRVPYRRFYLSGLSSVSAQCGGPTPTWPTVAGGKGPLLTAPDKQLSVGKGPLLSVPKLPGEIPCGRRFAI
jgi:hypothetical protein